MSFSFIEVLVVKAVGCTYVSLIALNVDMFFFVSGLNVSIWHLDSVLFNRWISHEVATIIDTDSYFNIPRTYIRTYLHKTNKQDLGFGITKCLRSIIFN